MRFNIDNIIVYEQCANESKKVDDMNLDCLQEESTMTDVYSFSEDGYKFILEIHADFLNANQQFYNMLFESNNQYRYILEGSRDFYSSAKRIVDKTLDWIKKEIDKCIAKIEALHKDKRIAEFNKEFTKIDNINFQFTGYYYTNIGSKSDIPLWDTTQMNLGSAKDPNEICDKFRGYIIGSKHALSAKNYHKELFKVFRDGEDSTQKINIDSKVIKDVYEHFMDYKDVEKGLNALYSKLTANYRMKLSEMPKLIKDKDIDKNNILSMMLTKLTKMCEIHIQAISARLQAELDAYTQYHKILNLVAKKAELK